MSDLRPTVNLFGKEIPTALIVCPLITLVILLVWLTMFDASIKMNEVYRDYFAAADAIVMGNAPYVPCNDLGWEYPPLSYVLIVIPRLFTSDPMTYHLIYEIMMFIFFVAELWLVSLFSKLKNKDPNLMITIVAACSLILWTFIFERFDIVTAVIVLAALYLYVCKKYPAAFALVAIGTLIKMYPALLFPVFIIPFLASRDWKSTARYTAITCIIGLVICIPFLIWAGTDFFHFLTYHSARGLQVESIAASFIIPLQYLGVDLNVINSFGSSNLTGAIPDAVGSLMMPLMAIMLLAFYWIYYKYLKEKENCFEDPNFGIKIFLMTLVSILAFIVFNKVFSAQYMMWIIPLIGIVINYERPLDKYSKTVVIMMLSSTIITATFWIIYSGIQNLELLAVTPMIIRNALILLFMVYIVIMCYKLRNNIDVLSKQLKVE